MRLSTLAVLAVSLGCSGPAAPVESAAAPSRVATPAATAPTEPAAPAPTEPAPDELTPTEPAPTEPVAGAAVEPSAGVITIPPEPGINVPAAARPTPPLTPPPGVDPVLGALESVPAAVTLGERVSIGDVEYVLYTVDVEAIATADLTAHENGEFLIGALEDMVTECAAGSFARRFECMAQLAPHPGFALAEWGLPTGVGIARVEEGVVTARRSLLAATSGRPVLSLASRDIDDDGAPELIVETDITVVTDAGEPDDDIEPRSASGTLVYLLDRDLTTRFRFARRLESNAHPGEALSCTFDYELRDVNGDGHTDLHVDRLCQSDDAEDPVAVPTDCVAEGGRFTCSPVGTYFFDPALGVWAETLDELRAALRVGRRFREVEARLRRELTEE